MSEEDVDPSWWAEKVRQVARFYCPGCEPDLDPTEECVSVMHCPAHDPNSENRSGGDADERVRPAPVYPVSDLRSTEDVT